MELMLKYVFKTLNTMALVALAIVLVVIAVQLHHLDQDAENAVEFLQVISGK